MKRFKNILLVYDERQAAPVFQRAAELARNNRARLTILALCREPSPEVRRFLRSGGFPGYREIAEKEWLGKLEGLKKAKEAAGLSVKTAVRFGTPFLEIVRKVLGDGHDLVMMTAEGAQGLREMIFGSTSMHVLRKCPCPVWVFRPGHRPLSRVLAAVDPVPPYDESYETKSGLNRKILELASSLAGSEAVDLHIVHAWELLGEGMLTSRGGISRSAMEKLGQETSLNRRRLLDQLVHEHSLWLPKDSLHLLKGEPGTVIPELAAAKGIDLIVMGTVSRTGISGFLMENTAEKILSQVKCSVLAVKPDGFVSPVELE
jgi:nucleotide-binding universal stress UspA family protein